MATDSRPVKQKSSHVPSVAPSLSARRTDIDWLRIIAMFLLIVTHTSFLYKNGWRMQSSHGGEWGDIAVMVMAPWRMSLIFLIGGVATRFLLTKFDFADFATNRLHRLILPFIVSIILIIPPMNYVRLDNLGMPEMSYLEFLSTKWRAYNQMFGVWLPDFGPSWFLPYLFSFALAAAIVWNFARPVFTRIERAVGVAPIAVLLLTVSITYMFSDHGMLLRLGWQESTIRDLMDAMRFFPIFLIGLFVAKSDSFWQRLQDVRYMLWLAAPILLITTLIATAQRIQYDLGEGPNWIYIMLGAPGLYSGVMIFSILAAGARWLTKPSPALHYFNDAILPVYLLHQTVIVLVADRLLDIHLPLALEFFVIFCAALALPLAIHHFLIRPFPPVRLAFGLRPHPRGAQPKAAKEERAKDGSRSGAAVPKAGG